MTLPWEPITKVAITAAVVVAISEVGKRSSFWAAALASLPLTSVLAFVWLYLETGDAARVAAVSRQIFWLVLPSLLLFVTLPLLLRWGMGFWPALALSCLVTGGGYFAMIRLLSVFGVSL